MSRRAWQTTRGGHPATIVKAWGVAPDAAGAVSLRVVGFRAHCPECGYLGGRREGYYGARWDVFQHKRATIPRTSDTAR